MIIILLFIDMPLTNIVDNKGQHYIIMDYVRGHGLLWQKEMFLPLGIEMAIAQLRQKKLIRFGYSLFAPK